MCELQDCLTKLRKHLSNLITNIKLDVSLLKAGISSVEDLIKCATAKEAVLLPITLNPFMRKGRLREILAERHFEDQQFLFIGEARKVVEEMQNHVDSVKTSLDSLELKLAIIQMKLRQQDTQK